MGDRENTLSNQNSDFKRWILQAFEEKGFKDISFEVSGSTEIGDGYLGDVVFFKVTTGTPLSSDCKVHNVVLKFGKKIKTLMEAVPVKLCYEREIFFYIKIVPLFRDLEKQYNLNIVDGLLPNCVNAVYNENDEVLILQDLKSLGYKLHNKLEPFDFNHLKITFKAYGKWHALSLALREKEPALFMKNLSTLQCLQMKFLETMRASVFNSENGLYKMISSDNDTQIVERLKKHFPEGFYKAFINILKSQDKENYVILQHGDCWNNNFMFKYHENSQGSDPVDVILLDFQATRLASPVLDLSYHLYSNASEAEFRRSKELLQIYYSSLSVTLESLGCEPQKAFPYSEFVRQWKKYSKYGVLMNALVLPLIMTAKEDTLGIEALGSNDTEIMERIAKKNRNLLFPRMTAAVKHFLDGEDFNADSA